MNRQKELLSELRCAVAEVLQIPLEQITLEARYLEDLGATSLDLATLVIMLEDNLNADLPYEEFRDVKTVADSLQLIQAHLPEEER